MNSKTMVATTKLSTFPTLSAENKHHSCLNFYVLTINAEILSKKHGRISTYKEIVKTSAISTAKISYVGRHANSPKRRKEPCFDG